MATACNLKEKDKCCRTEITDVICPSALRNMSGTYNEELQIGSGCARNSRKGKCFLCPCNPNFCCGLGDLCNGWNGDLVQTGQYSQSWYCEEFHDETTDLIVAPMLLLLLLILPGTFAIRKIGKSRGGECYQREKRNKVAVAPMDSSSDEEVELKIAPPGRPKLKFQPISGR